jgi:sulfatase modifying factor 1
VAAAKTPISADSMTNELLRIPAQSAVLGSEQHYAEEGPARTVSIDGFSIHAHPVTNAEFTEFVSATGYLTIA